MDAPSPVPYDPLTLSTNGLGGSEASVVRIAERLAHDLAADGGIVAVAQRARTSRSSYNALYGPLLREWLAVKWDAIIVVRDPAHLPLLKQHFPSSRLVLWLQDLADRRLIHPAIQSTQPMLVTVSEFHTRNVNEWFDQHDVPRYLHLRHIFNPIDDDLVPRATDVNIDKLVFFSSPNKGLDWTLDVFAALRRAQPAFQLYVANPGYKQWAGASAVPDGVHDLGVLPHQVVMQHVAESLCALLLNDVYPETFGCVFAEANAVGTPVLTHTFGAAPEVLNDPRQTIDVRDSRSVVERLVNWRLGGRPRVQADDRFRTTRLVDQWKDVLGLRR